MHLTKFHDYIATQTILELMQSADTRVLRLVWVKSGLSVTHQHTNTG
jgi:hypothetical protein